MKSRSESITVGVNTLFLIPGEVGGTETYLRRMLHAIAEYRPELDLCLFTNRENHQVLREDLAGYARIHYVPLGVRASNRYARIIAEQLLLPMAARRMKADLLWSPGYTAPLFAPCPQVVTIHDMQYKTHPEDLSFHYRAVTDILVRAAAQRAERILADSEFTRSEIARFTAAPAGRIDVAPLAADVSYAEPLAEEARRAILADLIPGSGKYILCVANTYPHKNVHALVDAFARLAGIVPHGLVLVGSPRLGEPELRAALAGLSDARRVVRLERVNNDQLRALYQGADIFVLPSLYEGFGLPVLEAMMAGVPVIATKRASIPEVGGGNVVYFATELQGDLEDKIRAVLRWPRDKRARWTADARERAKSFTWRRTAELTAATFKRVLESAF